MSTTFFLGLSAILFTLGAFCFLVRRNSLVVLMGVELMLNAANLGFLAVARQYGSIEGQIAVLFVIVIAAAEVVVGLAIIVSIFRAQGVVLVDDQHALKG
ncbi:NADH-quinone oxidoreductase subunit NuoK [Corynebacterium uterequi]|uniref:NADH-quinone oxidoreductase subunit K n=1 Tax=Corynebacterium uterequi TaxID=1072256 RepID=A0A0G3HD78_9CORY|nr:NADH-quinone oxidoreductase subunit NuoK [Corynebacterium uterequi]AKK10630.1 NADH:ubiquinone oxidoreductase subunit 11 or 4L (chain K) [Corynebacterium uterequi]